MIKNLISNRLIFISFATFAIFTTSCATIVGGSNYYAKVHVPNHPNATIEYKGWEKGQGEVSFKAPRAEANQFQVTVKEEGCISETHIFTQRKMRGWAIAGSLVTWSVGFYDGNGSLKFWFPLGLITDSATGAIWKPDINEKGVMKQDYKHYMYRIDYTGCDE